MTVEELGELFASWGINTERPGFYNDPIFLAKELEDYTILERYAEFVLKQRYDPTYLDFAKNEVESAAVFLNNAVTVGGRLGGCIDASLLLQRFLELRGVWCFMVKGALTIEFPEAGIPTARYQPSTINQAVKAGHCWVCAPPYMVVDITLRQQPYSCGEENYLPDRVLSCDAEPYEWNPSDIWDSREFFSNYGKSLTMANLLETDPRLESRIQLLGSRKVHLEKCIGHYVACGVGASEEIDFGKWPDNLNLGKSPQALFSDYFATLC